MILSSGKHHSIWWILGNECCPSALNQIQYPQVISTGLSKKGYWTCFSAQPIRLTQDSHKKLWVLAQHGKSKHLHYLLNQYVTEAIKTEMESSASLFSGWLQMTSLYCLNNTVWLEMYLHSNCASWNSYRDKSIMIGRFSLLQPFGFSHRWACVTPWNTPCQAQYSVWELFPARRGGISVFSWWYAQRLFTSDLRQTGGCASNQM